MFYINLFPNRFRDIFQYLIKLLGFNNNWLINLFRVSNSDGIEDELFQNNASKSVKRSKSTKTAKANSGKIDDDHDEYAFCTPPPLVKRRKSRKKSIFVTDTETGSSEVSWFSKFKLFDTPTRSYSDR